MTALPSALPLAAAPTRSRGYWGNVLRRFTRDPVALLALAVVAVLALTLLAEELHLPRAQVEGELAE